MVARRNIKQWNRDAGSPAAPERRVRATRGFTLVEMMIVVAIIGMLAAICIPGFVRAREASCNARFASDAEVAKTAFIQYSIDNAWTYPPDVTPGVMPAGMDAYLGRFPWSKPTALGGRWDWDNGQFGTKAGVSVYQPTASDQQLLRLDAMVDDGDLTTGMLRKRSSGYISILE